MNRKLSVVVPAYRESSRIAGSLRLLDETLAELNRAYEIILVIDGCADTYAASATVESPNIRIYHNEKNMGKGHALKYGAARTTGDLVTFIDADMNIDPHQIDTFISIMNETDADIVIGSKRHPDSVVNYPAFRRLQSFAYQMVVATLFQINVKDTQTGLKLLRRDVLQAVMPRVLVKNYAFDLELLTVAQHLGYSKIVEAPVVIKEQFSTTTNLLAVWRVLLDTAAIFYRLRILKYYDRDLTGEPEQG